MLIRKENMFLLLDKSSGYGSSVSSSSPLADFNPGIIAVVAIVAFILTIVLLVTIVERKKAPRSRFLRWLREYLNFRSIMISGIIKFVYLFLAVFLTIMSVVIMCMGRDEMVLPMIGIGFAIMVFGNIGLRIMLELTMALIVIWENTSDMRSVMVKTEEMPEEKKPKEPKEKKVEEKPRTEEVIAKEPVVEKVVAEQQQVQPQPPVQQPPVAPQA